MKRAFERTLETSESEDVLGSLRHALACARLIEGDPHAAKWLFLALHSALQGAFICHLVTTAPPIGIISDGDAVKWHKYLRESNRISSPQPRTFVLELPKLMSKARIPRSAGDGLNENGISLTDDEFEWIKRLHIEVRNQFVHFSPMGWTILLDGIPDFSRLVARIIREILDHGHGFRHLSQHDRKELRMLLDELADL